MMAFKTLDDLTNAIRVQISTKDSQAIKALLSIYEYQTDLEKTDAATLTNNGDGFLVRDASFLTSLAKQYLTKGTLTARQIEFLKRKIPHYARQLVRHGRAKGLYKKTENGWEVVFPKER